MLFPAAFDERDPDIEQALEDFEPVGREMREMSRELLGNPSPGRAAWLQARIAEQRALIFLRAGRIGNIGGAALVELVSMRLTEKDRRGRPPPAGITTRTALDAVIAAAAAEAAAITAFKAARADMLDKREALRVAEEAYRAVAAGRIG